MNTNLCALLFFIINDFLAYGNLSDYIVKGHHAFLIFEKNTIYHEFKYGRNTSYFEHQRFLNIITLIVG